ncbi:hypothetical protein V5O48_010918 [Marasmius crinis-equi]|uniref:F-box domain-containing protein n=1 Tax=Marasmius crinis-equi TaxID=585013 RepID=A0ABR3F7H8_9AGAR
MLLETRREGVKLWLERSGTLPVHISLGSQSQERWSFPLRSEDTEAQALENSYSGFMRTLTGFSLKWRSLSLNWLPPSVIRPLSLLQADDLPRLDRIHETGTLAAPHGETLDFNIPSPLLSLFEQSLALRSLHVEIFRDSDLDRIASAWARLNVLNISVPACENGTVIVQKLHRLCPLLTECSLDLHVGTSNPAHSPPATEWTHLRKLKVSLNVAHGVGHNSELYSVFKSMTTPILSHLHVVVWGSTSIIDQDEDNASTVGDDPPFHDLILRSKCELVSLCLFMDLRKGFHDTLRLLPSLTSLTIAFYAGSPNYLVDPGTVFQLNTAVDALTDKVRVCHGLKELRFVACHPASAPSFLDLVRARARMQPSALEKFTVEFISYSSRDLEVLTSLLAEMKPEKLGVTVEWELESGEDNESEEDTSQAYKDPDPREGLPVNPKRGQRLVLSADGSEVRHYDPT